MSLPSPWRCYSGRRWRRPLSVHGFYPTHWGAAVAGGSNTLDGFPQTLIVGGWPKTPAELTGYGLTARLHGLRETVSGGSVDAGLLNPRAGEHEQGERLQFELDDRATLALAVSRSGVSRVCASTRRRSPQRISSSKSR